MMKNCFLQQQERKIEKFLKVRKWLAVWNTSIYFWSLSVLIQFPNVIFHSTVCAPSGCKFPPPFVLLSSPWILKSKTKTEKWEEYISFIKPTGFPSIYVKKFDLILKFSIKYMLPRMRWINLSFHRTMTYQFLSKNNVKQNYILYHFPWRNNRVIPSLQPIIKTTVQPKYQTD